MKTENLSWFEAIYHIRDGKEISNADWNDPERKVYFDYNGDGIPDVALMDYEEVRRHRNNYAMKLDAASIVFLQNIYLAVPGEEPKKGYHPVQADFVSTNWFVVVPPVIPEDPITNEQPVSDEK